MILDLFAGAGGWDVGARTLGLDPVGLEMDRWACATRAVVGLPTIRCDVTQLPLEPFIGKVEGLIASPPCPDFSLAGKGAGIEGATGRLMWEVPRWVKTLEPTWVACEQVPPALEWWERFAIEFQGLGYKTWTGVLNAADVGVPQTRQRAFLLASRGKTPLPPEPSHSDEPGGFWGLLPWVSMAAALGWPESWEIEYQRGEGMVERHGDRPHRRATEPAFSIRAGAWTGAGWKLHTNRGQDENGKRQTRPAPAPAPAVTGKAHGQWAWERPSTTVVGSFQPTVITPPGHRDWSADGKSRQDSEGAIRVTIPELSVLQSFPADYPWQGNKSAQATQIGNAVPPLLAAAVLRTLAS